MQLSQPQRATVYFLSQIVACAVKECQQKAPEVPVSKMTELLQSPIREVTRGWVSGRYNAAYILETYGVEYAARFLKDEIVIGFFYLLSSDHS